MGIIMPEGLWPASSTAWASWQGAIPEGEHLKASPRSTRAQCRLLMALSDVTVGEYSRGLRHRC
jgi:hypothetical protein